MKIKLTYLQAYNAMYRFIDTYYWRMMPIEEIAGLLGNMSFFNNNGPNIWMYAKFLALHRAITLILYGYDIKDKKMLAAAIQSYELLQIDR